MSSLTFKKCNKCNEEKVISDFYYRSDTGKPRSTCKECISAQASKRWRTDKEYQERGKIRSRKHMASKLYRLTLEEYNNYIDKACGICNTIEGRMVVDHCHTTGEVRGTLCQNCNTGIGMLKDSPELVRRALKWLEKD